MSAGLGRSVREALFSAPRTAWSSRPVRRSSTSLAVRATTLRADSLELSGMTLDRDARVATRWMSGSTLSRISGSISRERSPRRSMASVCMTLTTRLGK